MSNKTKQEKLMYIKNRPWFTFAGSPIKIINGRRMIYTLKNGMNINVAINNVEYFNN